MDSREMQESIQPRRFFFALEDLPHPSSPPPSFPSGIDRPHVLLTDARHKWSKIPHLKIRRQALASIHYL